MLAMTPRWRRGPGEKGNEEEDGPSSRGRRFNTDAFFFLLREIETSDEAK
jgi:hypothetical protein